jgi:hypothetical protein
MLFVSLFQWWYGQGLLSAFRHAQNRTLHIAQIFDIPLLLKTLFAPWRRIVTTPGNGIDAHIRAFFDNLISRIIGSIVRTIVIFAALILLCITLIMGLIEVMLWPILPLMPPVLIIFGVMRL